MKSWLASRYGIAPSVIDAVLDQARKYDIPVTAHIYSLADTEHLVRAGATGFLHMIQDTENIDPAFIARLRDLRIVFAPTLVRQELGWLYAERPESLDDPDVARSVDPDVVAAARESARSTHPSPAEREEFERAKRNAASAHDFGQHFSDVLRFAGGDRDVMDHGNLPGVHRLQAAYGRCRVTATRP